MKRLIRSAIPFPSPFGATLLVDARMPDRSIETVRGNATRMEFGLFDQAGAVLDLADVQSLNLKIQPGRDIAGPLADQTITEFDLTLDEATWNDGSKQHAVFEFSNSQMNLQTGGESRGFWLVITAILTGGEEVTIYGGAFVIHEDNNAAGDPPPENPGTALTLEQADARYAALGGGGGGGEVPIVVVDTLAEYLALPSETQMNGSIFIIPKTS